MVCIRRLEDPFILIYTMKKKKKQEMLGLGELNLKIRKKAIFIY